MDQPASPAVDRKGLGAAIGSYVLWGVFPLYWYLLKHVPSLQIIAHRIVWCAVFVVGWLLLREGTAWLRESLARPKVGRLLVISSLLISFNWGIYIWAVTHGRVVEASLGYFINPLVNVLLGVLVRNEHVATLSVAGGVVCLAGAWLMRRAQLEHAALGPAPAVRPPGSSPLIRA